VGLCAVLSARLLGAARIILVGHNEARLKLGQKFGATELVSTREDAKAIEEVIQMTHGGAECVSECVGNRASFDLAIGMARPGGTVGVPHVKEAIDLNRMFRHNISLRGGGLQKGRCDGTQ
jgi:alcohol dehydrogenase